MMAIDHRPVRRYRVLSRAVRPCAAGFVFEHLEARLSCSSTPAMSALPINDIRPIFSLPPGTIIAWPPIDRPTTIAAGLTITGRLPAILDHRETYAGPVATFTDERGGDPSDYSVTIDWGDGTPAEPAAVSRDPVTGVFTVTGSHTYVFGTYHPRVAVTDLRRAGTDADPGLVAGTSQVLAVFPPPVAGTAYPVSAVSGRTYRGVVATYVGLDTSLLARYAANVSWGDGQYDADAELVLNADGSVSVVAQHAYAAPGFYDVAVTLSERAAVNSTDGASAARSRATVVDGVVAGTAVYAAPLSGAPFQGNVAFFKYLSDSHADPSFLRAIVSLRDSAGGTALSGRIVPADGGFYVAIDHLFLNQGYVGFDVRVYDDALPAWQSADHLTGIFRGSINVDGHLRISPAPAFTATAGVPGRFLVGHVVSNDPQHLWNTTLAATINWGDNSSSPGELVPTPDGGFDVYGTHTYAVTGRSYDLSPNVSVTETRTPAAPGLPPGTQTASASSSYATYYQSHVNAGSFPGFFLFPPQYYYGGSGQIAAEAFTGTDVSDADFTAFATWEDGTVTPATITRTGDRLSIYASRNDLPNGRYTATLTVRAGDYEHSLDLSTNVYQPIDPSQYVLNATINTVPTYVFKGTHFHGVVATFTLNDPDARPEDFAASLNYFHRLANVVTSIVRNDDGSFSVVADFDTIDQSEYGYYPAFVRIARGQRSTMAIWSLAVTLDPALPDLQPKTALSFRQRQTFTTTVATFTAPAVGGPATPDRFIAVIEWGDGTTTAGVITKNWDGSFDISGTHSYHNKYGYLPLRVSLTDSVTGRTVFAQSSLSLDHDPVEVTPGTPDVSTDGDGVVSGTFATFIDEDGPSTNPDRYRVTYAALIDWGDGHITGGLVAQEPDGSYKVLSSHTYDTTGDFDISILVRRNTRYAPVPYTYTYYNDVGYASAYSAVDATLANQSNDFRVRLRVSVRRDNAGVPSPSPADPTPTSASNAPIGGTLVAPRLALGRARDSRQAGPRPPAALAGSQENPFSTRPLDATAADSLLDDSGDRSVLDVVDASVASVL